jgi:CubicO group peptidase (beta-lactamase class C family)
MTNFLKSALVLILISWQSGLIAAENAKVPLTEATPESQNLDSALLEQAVAEIAEGKYGDMDALLVLRNNYLVLEHYTSPLYHGRDYRRPAKSITKSVTSALVGIARGQGKMPPLDTNLLELFPQYTDIANMDMRKQKITLEHVLSMTAGFEWDEFSVGDTSEFKMIRSADWIKYTLDQPMSHSPGEKWVYNGGCSMMLSDILKNATETDVADYAKKYLFDPIGIENWNWSITRGNATNTAFGIAMSRRDMARFGVLYLNGGRWQGNQIVPQDWVTKSTSVQVLGKDDYFPYAYGYQWWRLQDQEPTVGMLAINDAYFALGVGGQFIFVVPHLKMVVVSTAANFGPDESLFLKLLRDHIFPAVLN